MEKSKECPLCSEAIPDSSIICPLCKSPVLPQSHPRYQAVQKKADAIHARNFGFQEPGPGRLSGISRWTMAGGIVSAILFGIFIILGRATPAALTSIVFSAASAVVTLVLLIRDLWVIPPTGRTTPERAVCAFYEAIKLGRYDRAYCCLSSLDKTPDERVTPVAEDFGWPMRRCSFDSEASFGLYWSGIVGIGGGRIKSLSYRTGTTKQLGPSNALVEINLTILSAKPRISWLGHFGYDTLVIEKEVKKLLYEHEGFWSIVNGELGCEEDLAIAILLGKD